MNAQLPDFNEISPTQGLDLDEKSALQNFLGKTRQEVFLMIQNDLINYEEDFACMGSSAFLYYMPSLCNVIKSTCFYDERLEEAVAAVLFIVEMRYINDIKNIDIYKRQILELLNICERKIQYFRKTNNFQQLVKREKRKIDSQLKRVCRIRNQYLSGQST